MRLFDIHCHILPGVDDGSKNMETSLDMLRIAYEEGTRNIVLTPHYYLEGIDYTYDQLDKIFEELKEKASEDPKLSEINLYLGNEIYYEDGILTRLKQGHIHTMNNTKYVLVEYNIDTAYSEILHSIDELSAARYLPVIAHVERYMKLQGKIDRIEELISRGCLLQMNISSIDGGFFDDNKKWCRKLVKNGYITFFATDAHNLDSRAPYTRDYISWIEKKCEDAEFMLETAAQMMIEGKYIN
ncbi:MAG: hypothetical protein K6E10_05445 [Eubacterium sp.]|nr:hypothetical protein [Eubacterium sp.]